MSATDKGKKGPKPAAGEKAANTGGGGPKKTKGTKNADEGGACLLYTSPSPRDRG